MIKKLLVLPIFSMLIFTGCFFEDEKPVKKRKVTNLLVEKVSNQENKDQKLSEKIENDGIVVDGARDERLLDAFGLAVSQVMVEEGVSVPDCSAVAKTGYLTEDECKEITDKYTGFYNLSDDGNAEKVDNIFSDGIKGSAIELGDSDFFDSSGNPLLENDVEFEELVVNSNNLEMLNKLKAKIPSNKIEMLKNISDKIEFLNDVQNHNVENQVQTIVQNKDLNYIPEQVINYDNSYDDYTEEEDTSGLYNSAVSRLNLLKAQHEKTEVSLSQSPNDESLIAQYNQELIDIAVAEQEVSRYAQ